MRIGDKQSGAIQSACLLPSNEVSEHREEDTSYQVYIEYHDHAASNFELLNGSLKCFQTRSAKPFSYLREHRDLLDL